MRTLNVSIHATLAGGDICFTSSSVRYPMFLSTPPSRVATSGHHGGLHDLYRFYPRHPRGWRQRGLCVKILLLGVFLSTPPSRVATGRSSAGRDSQRNVSIHATLAGGDGACPHWTRTIIVFLSTPPSRVATVDATTALAGLKFLSTPPSRVATARLLAAI